MSRIEVTEEHIQAVTSVVQYVWDIFQLVGGTLFTEVALPIDHITGEKGAKGTCDVLILTPRRAYVLDYKFGRYPVFLKDNPQLPMYGLGALEKFGSFYDWEDVTLGIIQPFINNYSEQTLSVNQLLQIGDHLRQKAEETRTNPRYSPSSETCKYCPKSGDCSAQTNKVFDMVTQGFEQQYTLAECYKEIPMIQQWITAIEEKMFGMLASGQSVDGYKLVAGRKGARKWTDEEQAADILKNVPRNLVYEEKLISPTTAEKKLLKAGIISKETFDSLPIIQSDSKPVVVSTLDPRPALTVNSLEGF